MKLKYLSAAPSISPLLLRFLIKHSYRRGFTLLELLIAMVIGSLIVSTLLYGVVNILQTDQRDASRSDTQRDIQMALDYIARDVREATYVYGVIQGATPATTESCLFAYGSKADAEKRGADGKCTGLLSFLPGFLTEDTPRGKNYPVLAFWKAEPLPSSIRSDCKTRAVDVGTQGTANTVLNATPCVSQRMYTLVVYSLNTEQATTFNWRGKARIVRYQLPHFTEGTRISGKPVNDGWVSPVARDKRPQTWPVGNDTSSTGIVRQDVSLQNEAPSVTGNLNQVLTDFVDDQPLKPYQAGYCPNGFDAPNGFTGAGLNTQFNSAFYVCVRRPSIVKNIDDIAAQEKEAAGQGLNPEVHIVLRGNAAGRGGIPLLTGEVPFQMETRVLSRGAFGKLSNNN